jgi:hypothetical protein
MRQWTAERALVVGAVRTPAEQDGAQPRDGVAAVNALAPAWLGNHAAQVLQMLPGGLDVLGLALACPVGRCCVTHWVYAIDLTRPYASAWIGGGGGAAADALTSRTTAANLRKVLMALGVVHHDPLVVHACTASHRSA